ncbi:MAG: preprotein translocase subunit YajC [Lentisphaeria bacterium]|jgi:preprotein translocase subunit YajC|nr:preprotein translocase subunit YajC [Lentisphaeria bacterium]
MDLLLLAQGAPPAGQPQGNNIMGLLVPLALMMVIAYVIMIRPQRRRQREHEERVKQVKAGDRIVTNGGIHGTIAAVKEGTFMMKIADNVKLEIEKGNIMRILSSEEVEDADDDPPNENKNRRKRN